MANQPVVPMLHVPNVRETVDWYKSIGFSVLNAFEDDDDGMTFAVLAYRGSQIFVNAGGRASNGEDRRDVDLYITTDDVEGLYAGLKGHVEIRRAPENTFYGTREFSVRDLNGFSIIVGQ